MRTNLMRGTAALTLAATAMAMAACGSSSSSSGSKAASGSHGKVTLSFVNWDGGMQSAVDQWNKENPDIQVQLTKRVDAVPMTRDYIYEGERKIIRHPKMRVLG